VSGGVTLEVGRCDPDAVATLLHGLPEWFGIAEEELRAEGVRYLQVKTLGPSRPDDEYERTRRFYEALGFRYVLEPQVPPDANPLGIYLKTL